jgi:hypothetical protein
MSKETGKTDIYPGVKNTITFMHQEVSSSVVDLSSTVGRSARHGEKNSSPETVPRSVNTEVAIQNKTIITVKTCELISLEDFC